VFFRQVLYPDLGCASYILGDAGEAVIVDPRWDVAPYLEIADAERLRITYVLDTHDHADHVSGRTRLARSTGACSLRAGGPGEPDAIAPGEQITVGALLISAVATPGHRPQHVSFAVTDLSRGPDPWLVLTGDSLLVGDLARPDLVLEPEEGAALLHSSLGELLQLPDHVEVWPAHVGGSLCGGAGLSGKTNSTIGFERRNNPLLSMDRLGFVRGLTAAMPPRPPSVDRIVELNVAGVGEPAPVRQLDPGEVYELLRARATVLDARAPAEFDAGHLAGALNLPVSAPGVGTRAGWSLSPEERIVVSASDPASAEAMVTALQAVGLGNVVGLLVGDGDTWEQNGLPVAKADSWDVPQLAVRLRDGAVDLVDVRDGSEWAAGHVHGSLHVPLHRLRDAHSLELPHRGRTLAVACAGGMRAAFAASVLRRVGHADVVRVAPGGIADLSAQGIKLAVGA
jgi:hydroxyacylglutathione hydrolase